MEPELDHDAEPEAESGATRNPDRWFNNSSRVYIRRWVERFAAKTQPHMIVLDAGAGKSPYRELFDHAKYEAADFAQLPKEYAQLDYVCDLTDIPVEDDRFHRIICNQVLEHVPEPGATLAELHRVLRPGGRILLTAPLYFAEHQQPYDFYRYTKFALERLFTQAGFEIDRISWLEGYFGTMSYSFRQMYSALPRNLRELSKIERGWRLVYLAPLVFGTKWLARVLHHVYFHADVRWKYTRRGMAKNYVVVAHKPRRTAATP